MNEYQPYQQQYMPMQTGEMPQELKKWSWGAFSFTVWWGIGHKAYLSLLVLVPFFSLIWMIVCGVKGHEWAWKAGNYIDANHFNAVMEPWNRAGKIAFIVGIIYFAFMILFFIIYMFIIAAAVGSSF